ncbi:DNA polymerase Y family protein [Poseidonocella sp. HB161398]|uniref:Y-family DNA polymerase n=1 Tax=Poseidonocella sp. HB161398 TaxID=2320855 RepID=UPI001109D974|nr:DNA polymerase Y family protein [Poseidonocella sp. HB161398]
MPAKRILSLWFPRMGAERCLRLERGTLLAPLVVLCDQNGAQVISSLSEEASAAGLRPGQPLRDAMAMCPALVTRPQIPQAEAAFLAGLRRWAGKFSPWVGELPPDGLVMDISGCAHLFGGEDGMMEQVRAEAQDLRLSLRAAIADTPGAAWALARYGGTRPASLRSGDAIDQEARATRSRAARRHPRSGALAALPPGSSPQIAPSGGSLQAIADLPVAALRLGEAEAAGLARLGLSRIGDLAGVPRAALARRFGREVGLRLDQALGIVPEPVSPVGADPVFATRLTLPEPIGLREDMEAAIDRLLPPLGARLEQAGRGARRLRLQAFRVDGGLAEVEIGLARPSADPARMRPLLLLKLDGIQAEFGIDGLRIEAHVTEPVQARQARGHLDAARDAAERLARGPGLDDLIARLGARIGSEAVTRLHPAESHIPEKTARRLMAAWSEPAAAWPPAPTPRPVTMWRPEPVQAPERPRLEGPFRWRRRAWIPAEARGPERISPEWWLDDPAWRSGVRDYWEVVTADGVRLWLFFAHGGALSPGWFCQGSFD